MLPQRAQTILQKCNKMGSAAKTLMQKCNKMENAVTARWRADAKAQQNGKCDYSSLKRRYKNATKWEIQPQHAEAMTQKRNKMENATITCWSNDAKTQKNGKCNELRREYKKRNEMAKVATMRWDDDEETQ